MYSLDEYLSFAKEHVQGRGYIRLGELTLLFYRKYGCLPHPLLLLEAMSKSGFCLVELLPHDSGNPHDYDCRDPEGVFVKRVFDERLAKPRLDKSIHFW